MVHPLEPGVEAVRQGALVTVRCSQACGDAAALSSGWTSARQPVDADEGVEKGVEAAHFAQLCWALGCPGVCEETSRKDSLSPSSPGNRPSTRIPGWEVSTFLTPHTVTLSSSVLEIKLPSTSTHVTSSSDL